MTIFNGWTSATLPCRARRLVITGVVAFVTLAAVPAYAAKPIPAKLTEQDKADLGRIETYLTSLRTLTASFLQVAPDGSLTRGRFYLSRPGKMRFEYDPPTPILMIANSNFLVYIDSSVNQVSYLPIDSTPVGLFIRERISLSDGVTITKIERGASVLRVSVRQTDDPDQGELTMVFSDKPLTLQQWVVVDAQRQTTKVSLLDVRSGEALDPTLFRVPEQKRDDTAK